MLDNIASLFDFSGSVEYLPELFRGALVSVELTFCVMVIGLVFTGWFFLRVPHEALTPEEVDPAAEPGKRPAGVPAIPPQLSVATVEEWAGLHVPGADPAPTSR